jgi:hypothetical protein
VAGVPDGRAGSDPRDEDRPDELDDGTSGGNVVGGTADEVGVGEGARVGVFVGALVGVLVTVFVGVLVDVGVGDLLGDGLPVDGGDELADADEDGRGRDDAGVGAANAMPAVPTVLTAMAAANAATATVPARCTTSADH